MDGRADKLDAAVVGLLSEGPTDVLAYNGPIDQDGFGLVVECTDEPSAETVTLCLTTLGGDPGSAYRIAALLGRRYKRFRLLVSSMCKSAGTLIAVGAHEIVMTDTGELGPLDVQIRKRDELLQRESGLELMQGMTSLTHSAIDAFGDMFLETAVSSGLSTRLCADIAANIVGQLYGNIFSQIDPIRVGSVARANSIAMHYGLRLGARSLKPDALRRLVLSYASHDFVIDRTQAEELFHQVRGPSPAEASFVLSARNLLFEPKEDEHLVARLDQLVGRNADDTPKQSTTEARGSREASAGRAPAESGGIQDVKADPRVARGSKPAHTEPNPAG